MKKAITSVRKGLTSIAYGFIFSQTIFFAIIVTHIDNHSSLLVNCMETMLQDEDGALLKSNELRLRSSSSKKITNSHRWVQFFAKANNTSNLEQTPQLRSFLFSHLFADQSYSVLYCSFRI